MNDLVIHTYQFIRLYILYFFTNNNPLPTIDDTFISYCIKTLGTRDNRGKKCKDTELLETLEEFYKRDTWRKMKFRQYSYGKKSIDVFLNKIKETFGENLLIGYGNWSRDTQMNFFMPTMNKGLRKLIHKKI
jgi:hypothetical protein